MGTAAANPVWQLGAWRKQLTSTANREPAFGMDIRNAPI